MPQPERDEKFVKKNGKIYKIEENEVTLAMYEEQLQEMKDVRDRNIEKVNEEFAPRIAAIEYTIQKVKDAQ